MTNERIRIGFDAKRIVRNGTGLGSYGRTLVNDLAVAGAEAFDLRLYAPDDGREDLRTQIADQPNVSFCYPSSSPLTTHPSPLSTLPSPLSSLLSPLSTQPKWYWRSRGIVSDLRRDGVRLFHGLSGELPVGLRKAGIRSVVTIHDLIFLRHPEYYHWWDTRIYTWKFRQTLREADHIIAISECTKRDIMDLGGVSNDRITVIYQSFAPRFTVPSLTPGTARRGERGRYILCVGTIEERKNALLAVQALHHLPTDLSLVLVGRPTKYADRIRQYAAQHGLSERVQMLHGVTDDELPRLYAEAEAFVYPSRYEGFGIPIIEATAMGLPVVACTGSCLQEAGGPDALYVSPDDAEGLAAALRCVLRGADGREQSMSRSRDFIRRFQGNDVARQVINVYQKLL